MWCWSPTMGISFESLFRTCRPGLRCGRAIYYQWSPALKLHFLSMSSLCLVASAGSLARTWWALLTGRVCFSGYGLLIVVHLHHDSPNSWFSPVHLSSLRPPTPLYPFTSMAIHCGQLRVLFPTGLFYSFPDILRDVSILYSPLYESCQYYWTCACVVIW